MNQIDISFLGIRLKARGIAGIVGAVGAKMEIRAGRRSYGWCLRSALLALAGALSIFVALDDVSADAGLSIDFNEVPTVHFPIGDRIVSAYPAFEDYAFMLFDICDAVGLKVADCLIFPMNADLEGNALATIVDGNRVIVYCPGSAPMAQK